MADFCRFCGASVPHRDGEGRCPRCEHHASRYYRAQRDWLRNIIGQTLALLDTGHVTEARDMLKVADKPDVAHPH